jgi:CBS domain-containing protein
MDEFDTRQIAVVDGTSNRVVGIVALVDVMRAQANALATTRSVSDAERSTP